MVNHFLSKKSSKFCIVRTIRLCSNYTSMWSKYLSNNVWRDFRFSNVKISNGNIKYPIEKSIFCSIFAVKNSTLLSLLMLSWEVLSLYIHYLINIWTTCWEIWTKLYGPKYTNFWAFDKKPGFLKNISDKALTPIWKTFMYLKQLLNAKLLISRLPSGIFQCSKNYGSQTSVTRLNVAPNMADPISISG